MDDHRSFSGRSLSASLLDDSQEVEQQRVYRLMASLAAGGNPAVGDWLELFHTDARQSLGQSLIDLLARLRHRQSVTLLSPAPHDRLEDLRGCLDLERLDGFILGHQDESLSEYVTPGGARLRWLTGFRGSAGLLLVLAEQAYLFVDGRYSLQAPKEVDPHFVTVCPFDSGALVRKVADAMPKEKEWRIGIDPDLFSAQSYQRLQRELAEVGVVLVGVMPNPVDRIWKERPPAPLSPIRRIGVTLSGAATSERLTQVCEILRDRRVDCLIVQAAAEILWLLNIRAADVDTAPLCLSRMIVHAEGSVDWFLSVEKLQQVEKWGDWSEVYLHPEEDFFTALEMLSQAESRVWCDPARISARVISYLEEREAVLYEAADPLWRLSASLNATEREGMRACHERDGCALVEFFAEIASDPIPSQESDLVERLREHRGRQLGYEQDSFHAIVAVRGNSAECHYRPIPDADERVRWGDILLIDSGGHYNDGTTDVTRVIAYDQGEVPLGAEFCRHYTLVLQGLIAISRMRFPVGTRGGELDVIARRPLWQAGLDYHHGTGHGVGSNSLVHFGPQRIARTGGVEPLEPGMVLSLEPGVYFAARYGIRLENLALVVEDVAHPGWLKFDNLTWVPFVRRMIVSAMLSDEERAWLNNYHSEVYRRLARNLNLVAARWLAEATAVL